MTNELARTTIAEYAEKLHALRAEIAELQTSEKLLTKILKDHCESTGEVIEVEGLPPLRVMDRGAGLKWDSSAVRALMEQQPQLWDRIVELGAVTISSTVCRDALKRGQLMGLPTGGIEQHQLVLAFDREKRR